MRSDGVMTMSVTQCMLKPIFSRVLLALSQSREMLFSTGTNPSIEFLTGVVLKIPFMMASMRSSIRRFMVL